MRRPKPNLPLDIAPEVEAALADGRAVVALESTIISHGMPYPDSLEMAASVEEIVRSAGATPATIAVINGRIRVGVDPAGLEHLALDKGVVKASGRDLAAVMVQNGSAGTTVSATMRIAALAGIDIFATGGVGGVHRGAEETFDISADLTELGSTPTAVVCAGVKSILDIPKTLEYLETQRVPVIAYGTDEFPAFFTRTSGSKADHRLDTPEAIAQAIAMHDALGSGTGLLIANPIPRSRRARCVDDRRNHRSGTCRNPRQTDRAEGRDAVPAGPRQRAFRRTKPDRQHRPGPQQCRAGSKNCAGACPNPLRHARGGLKRCKPMPTVAAGGGVHGPKHCIEPKRRTRRICRHP